MRSRGKSVGHQFVSRGASEQIALSRREFVVGIGVAGAAVGSASAQTLNSQFSIEETSEAYVARAWSGPSQQWREFKISKKYWGFYDPTLKDKKTPNVRFAFEKKIYSSGGQEQVRYEIQADVRKFAGASNVQFKFVFLVKDGDASIYLVTRGWPFAKETTFSTLDFIAFVEGAPLLGQMSRNEAEHRP